MDAETRTRMLALAGIELRSTQAASTGSGQGGGTGKQTAHVGAGSPQGGQFTSSPGGGGSKDYTSILPAASAYKSGGGSGGGAKKPATGTGIPAAPAASRTMQPGDSGEDVRYAQYAMNLLGFKVPQDGNYDASTADMVKQLQARLGVKKPNGKLSASQLHKLQDAVRLSPCVQSSRDLAFEADWEERAAEDESDEDVEEEDVEEDEDDDEAVEPWPVEDAPVVVVDAKAKLERHRTLALLAVPGIPAVVDGPDETTRAILDALDEWVERQVDQDWEERKSHDVSAELRIPGGKGGGRWTKNPVTTAIAKALEAWGRGDGPDDPFHIDGKPIDREPLRKAAVARGITLKRGASREDIVAALKDDVKGAVKTQREAKAARKSSAKFSITHGGKRIDVAVFTDQATGKKAILRETDDHGRAGRIITSQPDLAGLEAWAGDNGHTDIAGWAAKERGGKAEAPTTPKAPAEIPVKKATPREIASMGPEDAAAAAAAGRMSRPAAAKLIREHASNSASSAAMVGMGRPDSELSAESLARRQAAETKAAALRKLADDVEAGAPKSPDRGGARLKTDAPASGTKRTALQRLAESPEQGLDASLFHGPVDAKAAREVEVDNKVRAAYSAVLARKSSSGNRWVMLSDLRGEMGDGVSRKEVDAALVRLAVSREPGSAHVIPESNQKALTAANRAGAVHFGGQDKHAISFDDPSLRPMPTGAPNAEITALERQGLVEKFDGEGGPRYRITPAGREAAGGKAPAQRVPAKKAAATPSSAKAPTKAAAAARVKRSEKSRTQKAAGYPDRASVPADKAAWSTPDPGYDPPAYTAPSVLAADRTKAPAGASPVQYWADPADVHDVGHPFTSYEGPVHLDASGRPQNPYTRTGIQDRGLLGKWGANYAADPIVTRVNPDTGQLEMASIKRGDSGEWAIPGGMVDEGEAVSSTLAREFREETGANLDMSSGHEVYKGYVDDPRNTDNAWMETTAVHRHLSADEAAQVHLGQPDDTGEIQGIRWAPVDQEFLDNLYASHGDFVRSALKGMAGDESLSPDVRRQVEAAVSPATSSPLAGLEGLTTNQKRAKLRQRGLSKAEIDALAPLPKRTKAARSRELALLGTTRALGHDITPGHDQLHHYWTRDPRGLAKWIDSPTPWTTLEYHLEKFVGPERAKRMAAEWFHERFHYWPGADLNRVTHGKPPRGHLVGPG